MLKIKVNQNVSAAESLKKRMKEMINPPAIPTTATSLSHSPTLSHHDGCKEKL